MSSFPEQLPPRPQQKQRRCPSAGDTLKAYSLVQPDYASLCRAVCIIVILGVRTAMNILNIVRYAIFGRIAATVIFSLLGVIGFIFIGWCLAQIAQMRGRRKVLTIMLSRWHFDVFLAVLAVIHIGIFLGSFFGIPQIGLSISWVVMWLLIYAVAWIATRPAEPDTYA